MRLDGTGGSLPTLDILCSSVRKGDAEDPVQCLEQCRADRAHVHSTNYQDAFILVAEDCKATKGEISPGKAGVESVANFEYELVGNYKAMRSTRA